MQLSLLPPTSARQLGERGIRVRSSYVPNRQERPADLPKIEKSAETMEAMVLSWFADQRRRFERTGASEDVAFTATQCADALGLKITTVRPRITQLLALTTGRRLERCAWLPRRPTEDGGSEGWVRFKEDGL